MGSDIYLVSKHLNFPFLLHESYAKDKELIFLSYKEYFLPIVSMGELKFFFTESVDK